MMKRLTLALSFALASSLSAQDYTHRISSAGRIDFESHHLNCNPLAIAHDPLWFDGRGITAPRGVIHLAFPLANTGIDWMLREVHTPDRLRRAVVRFGLPLTPHLLQAYRGLRGGGRYGLNLYDWFYDFNSKQPLDVSKREILTRAALDVPLSCFARP